LADLIIPPRLRDAHRAGLLRVVSGGRSRILGTRIQVPGLRRDGREMPIELVVWRTGTDPSPRFHAFMHDITERLELQAERERARAQADRERYSRRLEQAQRLESLGQLAGGVAHDFNNLLAVILNCTAFAAEEMAAGQTEGNQHCTAALGDLRQVQQASERAARLTRQLLTFGRRSIAQPEVLNLNTIVTELSKLLRSSLGERITLATSLDPDLRLVFADPGQIEQVLVNLAVNARDAMPDGGTLTVETGNADIDHGYAGLRPGPPAGRYVQLTVSDTGAGMPPETAERAFEPFFTSKPKGEGTGLGLATVYGIISQGGGDVHIYSEPGIGTTVRALLPACSKAPAGGSQRTPVPSRRRGHETLLLVEDEPAVREVAHRILTRNGYQVIVAANGSQALDLAKTRKGEIHLLLTDVIMPGISGKDLAAKILADRPSIRIIYMSGYASTVLATQGALDPTITLLEKPFTEATLLNKIDRVLHNGQP
jgi:signal transduction histidine kinase